MSINPCLSMTIVELICKTSHLYFTSERPEKFYHLKTISRGPSIAAHNASHTAYLPRRKTRKIVVFLSLSEPRNIYVADPFILYSRRSVQMCESLRYTLFLIESSSHARNEPQFSLNSIVYRECCECNRLNNTVEKMTLKNFHIVLLIFGVSQLSWAQYPILIWHSAGEKKVWIYSQKKKTRDWSMLIKSVKIIASRWDVLWPRRQFIRELPTKWTAESNARESSKNWRDQRGRFCEQSDGSSVRAGEWSRSLFSTAAAMNKTPKSCLAAGQICLWQAPEESDLPQRLQRSWPFARCAILVS